VSLYIFLTLSLVLNLFFVWYVRELLIRFNDHAENFLIFQENMNKYEEHLITVYNLETFYGDSTLKGLLEHTKDFSEELSVMTERFSIEEEE